ncbi:MAG: FxDxF family PEP-CTERM protein [Gallionella sp.]|nr:FxDxF family PEP-CTERM protein [Gallionella sp.]
MFTSIKSISFCSLLASLFIIFSSAAYAEVTTEYDFGRLTPSGTSLGYVAPNNFARDPFAHLTATDNENGVWTFTLSINNNLFSYFGDNAYLQVLNFDFSPDPDPRPVSTFVESNVDGTTATWSYSGSGNGGFADIDFGTGFGANSSDRLSQDDYVTWNVTGLGTNSTLSNMYVKINGIDGGYQAKYMPLTTVVPEPETYAMMLVGLGLLGFTARRRRNEA